MSLIGAGSCTISRVLTVRIEPSQANPYRDTRSITHSFLFCVILFCVIRHPYSNALHSTSCDNLMFFAVFRPLSVIYPPFYQYCNHLFTQEKILLHFVKNVGRSDFDCRSYYNCIAENSTGYLRLSLRVALHRQPKLIRKNNKIPTLA